MREGSLEAPTRHPLDWRNPEFYDEASLDAELERVFDICHGCRRCVSLCSAFPTLFDLVDESKTCELDGVAEGRLREGRRPVLPVRHLLHDQVPVRSAASVERRLPAPHAARQGAEVRARATSASATACSRRTDAMGKLATIPVVVQMVNAASNDAGAAQAGREGRSASQRTRELPPYAAQRFRAHARAVAGVAGPRRRAHAGQGRGLRDLLRELQRAGHRPRPLKLLAHNEIPYVLVEKEACCGMPKLELGDLEAVEKLKNVNIPPLAALARDGYAILTPVPSCTLMFKQELPLMFPGRRRRRRRSRDAMFDPFEYFVLRDKDGLLKKEFQAAAGQGQLSHPLPLARAERRPEDARGAAVGAGHRGQHGRALRRPRRHVGREGGVLRRVDEDRQAGVPPDGATATPTSSAPTARSPAAGSCRASTDRTGTSRARKEHPLTLLRIAYGLES